MRMRVNLVKLPILHEAPLGGIQSDLPSNAVKGSRTGLRKLGVGAASNFYQSQNQYLGKFEKRLELKLGYKAKVHSKWTHNEL